MIARRIDHVSRREHTVGRWLPVLFYSVNYALWVVALFETRAWNLFWLAVFPLPALALYLLRTRRKRYGP
jgi:hypothetical protein